jgi:hypothetical protein
MLTEHEKQICKTLCMSEQQYIAERDRIAAGVGSTLTLADVQRMDEAPFTAAGLTADELKIVAALGITPEAYAEAYAEAKRSQ